ncbi:MAG TPA: hypothetical protein PKZ76_10550 [Xanthomonadaceae bacterium]|nr:hypothetical protein [Xanthomonadaceae bacterium]
MLLSLWLPILIITVALFFASFLAWAVLPHHKPDLRKWPDEDRLRAFVRESGAAPGEYLFPLVHDHEMKDPEAVKRYDTPPWGMVNVWPSKPSMGGNMVKTVLFFFVVTVLVGYVGAAALPAGATMGEVFRVLGTTAILAHTAGGVCREIWFTRPLRAKLMDAIDGLVYGVITGLVFALMWP